MKTNFSNSAMIAVLTLLLGLIYAKPVAAGSTIFPLSYPASTALSHASACWQSPPGQGPQLYYAGFRKHIRVRGLLVRQWLWIDNSSVGGTVGWVAMPSYYHNVWDSNNLAIFQMPYYGHYAAFYVRVSIPKVGERDYLVYEGWQGISNTCG